MGPLNHILVFSFLLLIRLLFCFVILSVPGIESMFFEHLVPDRPGSYMIVQYV